MDLFTLVVLTTLGVAAGAVLACAAPLRRGDPWRWPWLDGSSGGAPPVPTPARRPATGGGDGFITFMVALFILSALGSRRPPEEKGDG